MPHVRAIPTIISQICGKLNNAKGGSSALTQAISYRCLNVIFPAISPKEYNLHKYL